LLVSEPFTPSSKFAEMPQKARIGESCLARAAPEETLVAPRVSRSSPRLPTVYPGNSAVSTLDHWTVE
jgi:hypothetical protein